MRIAATEVLGERYRIVRPLGGGGMKSVYLAEDVKLNNRLCAVAAMIDNFANPEEQRAAIAGFQREADMLASLRNEHIPQIYDKFSEEQSHYLVMEFVEGDTLENRVKTAGGRLGEAETIDIAVQILDTLEYLHGLKPPVIYRDMKPGNVMVSADGKVKLIDFGIARFFQTSTVTLMGTPGFAPKEQYMGKVEERSDLYALAATLHQALSGRPAIPFDFPPLAQLLPGLNPHLSEVIGQALADNVDDRPPNAREFKNRLTEIRGELAGASEQLVQPLDQPEESTTPLRQSTTQPDSQTWVFNQTKPMSGPIGQGGRASSQTVQRQGQSQNFTPPAAVPEDIANDKTAIMTPGRGLPGARVANADIYEEPTETLDPSRARGVRRAGMPELKDQTWVLRDGAGQETQKRGAGLKIGIGVAAAIVLAVAAWAGINQWNEIQRQKALVAEHEQFEQQQQQALQAAERQKELLLQQQQEQQEEAAREAELRRQRQREAALERERRRQIQMSPQQSEGQNPYPEPSSTPPNSEMSGAVAAGVAGALGGVVGGLLGGAFSHSHSHSH
jgi:serine/threonine protein kinase